MKRKFLEDLGITEKETINRILDENSCDIGKAKGELDSVSKELDILKTRLGEREKQLEALEKSSSDNAELKKQIEDLRRSGAELKKAHEAEMARFKLNNAVEAALASAGAKNTKAVRSLLDSSKLKLADDGSVEGLTEQLNAVKKTDPYMFYEKQKPDFKGLQPGYSGDIINGSVIDSSNMTYSQLAAYMEANPDVKFD